MGGQSFKCPFCERWVLAVYSLRAHLRDKHMIVNATIDSSGSATVVCTQLPQPTKD